MRHKISGTANRPRWWQGNVLMVALILVGIGVWHAWKWLMG